MSEGMLRCKQAATPTDSKSALASPTRLTSLRVRDSQPVITPHKAKTGASAIVQNQENETEHHETPDLSSQLERAKRYGHNLSQVKVANTVRLSPANLIGSKMIQCRLKIGQPGDRYEQEADRVAERVMAMPAPSPSYPVMRSLSETIQRKCAACEQEDKELMRKASGSQDMEEGAIEQVRAVRSGGQPLDRATRNFMESRFGHDFSQVRIHADSQASDSAQAINARAYTTGQDIVFASGQYAPGTDAGKRLLAHELTHVVQQTGSVQTKLISNYQTVQQSPGLTTVSERIQRIAEQNYTPDEEQNYTPAPEEFNYTPGEDEAAELGQEALQTVGYEKIIQTALEAGFLKRIKNGESTTIQAKLQVNQDTVFRQEAAAWEVFTEYAVAAGVASQVDSPAPGPGDLVGLGILVVGLAAAGYILMNSIRHKNQTQSESTHPEEQDAEDAAEQDNVPCDEIIRHIENLIEALVGRYNDLIKYKGGDEGHRERFAKVQRILEALMVKAIATCKNGEYDDELAEEAQKWRDKKL